jgi:hypothetical protein
MSFFEIVLAYLGIGVLCGMSIEVLMTKTDMNDDTTNFERFTWLILWPLYVILFIIGMKK